MHERKGKKGTLPVTVAARFRHTRYAHTAKVIIPIAPLMATINVLFPLPFLPVTVSHSAYINIRTKATTSQAMVPV